MRSITGWGARLAASLSDNKGGPWGSSGGGADGGGDGGDGDGPRSPWGQPPRRRPAGGAGNIASIEDLLKKGRERFGGRFPQHEGKPYWAYGLAVFALLWIMFTSFHVVGAQERGVVTLFGRYSRTLSPGVNMTLPSPIERMQKIDVGQIRATDVGGEANSQNLIITGDSNLIDVAYTVRWSIRDPQLYLFSLAAPDATVTEVSESAMRAVVATVTLDDAIGAGRGDIETRVGLLMQQMLDRYGAGIRIEGVAVKQSDPPAAVLDAFKAVSAAQQAAQGDINNAKTYALQITARAQGDATAFDKVYAQYKLAPEVTRRRIYYETMERVLSKVDKTVIEAPGVTPYLPLPAVQRQAQNPEGAAK
ncbi:MAG: protease modulator HflK [Allosphingosinicella sp.]